MKNAASTLIFALTLALLPAGAALAQASGRITYEATQRIDLSKAIVMMNGQQIKLGGADSPTIDMPESRSFGLTLLFAGDAAKKERENVGMTIRTGAGGPSGSLPSSLTRPKAFQETTFLDLAARNAITVLTVQQADAPASYRADAPIAAPTGWTMSPQTRKIAGYTCRKATVLHQKQTYTVWVTTNLPFTYSPVRGLTPARGVVLALESEQEQFQAAKVSLQTVPAAEVQPTADAQKVTPAELKDLRDKALANFRQQLLEGSGSRFNRN